jgi:hypothetical protein
MWEANTVTHDRVDIRARRQKPQIDEVVRHATIVFVHCMHHGVHQDLLIAVAQLHAPPSPHPPAQSFSVHARASTAPCDAFIGLAHGERSRNAALPAWWLAGHLHVQQTQNNCRRLIK